MEYMTDTERFTLIDGEFSKHEAKDILLGMLNYKISFHELRNFSSSIQQGENDSASINRIEELEKTRQEMIAFFAKLDDTHKLKIKSKVIIEYGE